MSLSRTLNNDIVNDALSMTSRSQHLYYFSLPDLSSFPSNLCRISIQNYEINKRLSPDLSTLLKTLTPTLHESTYVFVTLPYKHPPPSSLLISPSTIITFRDDEGLTIITTFEVAQEDKLDFVFPSKVITLEVQSSLEAVGFMAMISKALAERRIECNPASGFFHDHCFVPVEKVKEAEEVLRKFAAGSGELGNRKDT